MGRNNYVTRIDEEIAHQYQVIDRARVEIAKLEEARLIVASFDAAEPQQRAMTERIAAPPKAPKTPKLLQLTIRKKPPEPDEVRPSPGMHPGSMPSRLMAWFREHPDEHILSGDLIEQMGLAGEDRQRIYHGLSSLRQRGELQQDGEDRFYLPPHPIPKRERKKGARRTSRQNPVSMRERIRNFLKDQDKALLAREIIAGLSIDTKTLDGRLDEKLLGQSISAMKTHGEIAVMGSSIPYRYALNRTYVQKQPRKKRAA